MRLLIFIVITVAVAGSTARAQSTSPAPAAADERAWSFSASAYTYLLSDDRDYVQPTVTADHGRLHLEARANYENLDTGSVWVGARFRGGKTVTWGLTPMFGGVFGDTTGYAPGLKGSLGWWKFELDSENEYVIDTDERSDSFFYNWSELTLAPVDWFRVGAVVQRTRVYQSDREIQRGVMAGVSWRWCDLTGYVFNPDEDKPRFVFAVAVDF